MKQCAILNSASVCAVRWTNNGNQYSEPGTVAKINTKSVRVTLERDVIYPSWHMHAGKVCYPAGHSIIVPAWPFGTAGNGVFETAETEVKD